MALPGLSQPFRVPCRHDTLTRATPSGCRRPGTYVFPARLSPACRSCRFARPRRFRTVRRRNAAPVFVETNENLAVIRAAGDLVEDVQRVTGTKPELASNAGGKTNLVIIGTLGQSKAIDRLVTEGKLDVTGVRGRMGKLHAAGGQKSAAGCRPGAGHRRQRPARDDLRDLPVVGTHRRLAVVLVGGRAGEDRKILSRCTATFSSRVRRR